MLRTTPQSSWAHPHPTPPPPLLGPTERDTSTLQPESHRDKGRGRRAWRRPGDAKDGGHASVVIGWRPRLCGGYGRGAPDGGPDCGGTSGDGASGQWSRRHVAAVAPDTLLLLACNPAGKPARLPGSRCPPLCCPSAAQAGVHAAHVHAPVHVPRRLAHIPQRASPRASAPSHLRCRWHA